MRLPHASGAASEPPSKRGSPTKGETRFATSLLGRSHVCELVIRRRDAARGVDDDAHARGGKVAVISVSDATVKVTDFPPKVTAVAPVELPVRVTRVPPTAARWSGCLSSRSARGGSSRA
jgi:hypothetical protein